MDSEIRTIDPVIIQTDLNSSREKNFLEQKNTKPKKKSNKI